MRCCFCDREMTHPFIKEGYLGNNPYPLVEEDDYDSRCCDFCNNTLVTPTRMGHDVSLGLALWRVQQQIWEKLKEEEE